MIRAITAVVAALAVVTVAHAESGASPDGAKLFQAKCAACHGKNAEGASMSPNAIAGTPEATVKKTISEGKGKMKPVKTVTGPEIDAIAKHVAGLPKPPPKKS